MRAVYYLAFSAAVLAVMIMLNLALWLALLYLVVAGLGGVLAYRDAQARAAMQRWVQDVGNRTIAETKVAHEAAGGQPWYPQAMAELAARAKEGRAEFPFLTRGYQTANPYFLLPLDGLVRHGLASQREVDEALRLASAPEPPLRWWNPILLHDLKNLGWSREEALAHIGVMRWRLPDMVPDLKGTGAYPGHGPDVPVDPPPPA